MNQTTQTKSGPFAQFGSLQSSSDSVAPENEYTPLSHLDALINYPPVCCRIQAPCFVNDANGACGKTDSVSHPPVSFLIKIAEALLL